MEIDPDDLIEDGDDEDDDGDVDIDNDFTHVLVTVSVGGKRLTARLTREEALDLAEEITDQADDCDG